MPDFSIEDSYNGIIAGVDEAGRGPWAGPVVAAAVIINKNSVPKGINDSKKLTALKREKLYEEIISSCHFGVGIASVEEIDSLNILNASMLAMQRAFANLPVAADIVLVDGNKAPDLKVKAIPIIKGDSISISIAAASIIAKVTRDRMMLSLAAQFPYYAWERNSGYGTKAHQDGIKFNGITMHHRKSFKPIQAVIGGDTNSIL